MGDLEAYKPEIAMVALQFFYAWGVPLTRAALVRGMSPWVYVVYRSGIAALVMAPMAYFSRRKSSGSSSLGLRGFAWVFVASLFGLSAFQIAYFEGLFFSSSTVTSAMSNLVPVVTFVIAFIAGWEKVDLRSLRSIAKILGTVICVGGAISMALLKGPKLVNSEFIPLKSLIFIPGVDKWLLGCLLVFASSLFWSFWLILQVPISKSCPDHLYSTAWMCFLATLELATVAFFLDKNPEAWTLHSFLELVACLYSGIGLAVSSFVQTWCISKTGPLFCAMFNPLCTVIVTMISGFFLHEEIYIGSLIGVCGVIIGLYAVLWGKGKDHEQMRHDTNHPNQQNDRKGIVQVVIEETPQKKNCKIDLQEPLLLSS
ncbi:WAT1-related protein [Melia azedarach]|uniref:WAT1-related protein n=1 Tax=Melia azedarach TaxID=155640 RepID=A0ACC1XE93_MELAZ|nr:WAT1-related protein [Melia azedarach]